MSRSLELPDDVLQIIKAYAQPVTRPDWKTYIVMSEKRLHAEFEKQLCIRYRRLTMTHGTEYLRLMQTYKPIFDNNYYKQFKHKITI